MMGAWIMVGEEVVHVDDIDVADALAGGEAGLGGGAETGAAGEFPFENQEISHLNISLSVRPSTPTTPLAGTSWSRPSHSQVVFHCTSVT